jgi:hypothetical protein
MTGMTPPVERRPTRGVQKPYRGLQSAVTLRRLWPLSLAEP